MIDRHLDPLTVRKHQTVPSSNVHTEISWHASLDAAGEFVAKRVALLGLKVLTVVPSSLSASDRPVSMLRTTLRRNGIRTSALVPRSPVAAMLARGGPTPWMSSQAAGRSWRLDTRLLGSPYVSVSNVDESLRRGPFVLDLPSRFLHPRDRITLAARPDRHRVLSDIAATALPVLCIVLTSIADGWLVMATEDPVAAELWSLAAAERFLDGGLEMQGPWEDPAVQRATELELGARYPGELAMTVHADTDLPATARKLLYSMNTRLGMSLDTR